MYCCIPAQDIAEANTIMIQCVDYIKQAAHDCVNGTTPNQQCEDSVSAVRRNMGGNLISRSTPWPRMAYSVSYSHHTIYFVKTRARAYKRS